MVKEPKHGLMAPNIPDNGRIIKLMGMANLFMLIIMYMKVNLKMILPMEKVLILMTPDKYILEIGSMIYKMEVVRRYFPMEANMLDNLKTERRMG